MNFTYPTSLKFGGNTNYSSASVSILPNPKSLTPLEWFKQISPNGTDVQCRSFVNKLLSADESLQQFEVDQFTVVNNGGSFRIYSRDNPDNVFLVRQRLADFKADLKESTGKQSGSIGAQLNPPKFDLPPKNNTNSATSGNNTTPTTTISKPGTATTVAPKPEKKQSPDEIMAKYKSKYDPGPDTTRQVRVDAFTKLMRDQHENPATDFAALVHNTKVTSQLLTNRDGLCKRLDSKSFQLNVDNITYKYTLEEQRGSFNTMEVWREVPGMGQEEKRIGSITGLTFADFNPDPYGLNMEREGISTKTRAVLDVDRYVDPYDDIDSDNLDSDDLYSDDQDSDDVDNISKTNTSFTDNRSSSITGPTFADFNPDPYGLNMERKPKPISAEGQATLDMISKTLAELKANRDKK